jgi:hypothetical protein
VIPEATTTITVTRAPTTATQDPYEAPPARVTIAMSVRACISQERGRSTVVGSTQETVTWRLDSDPVDLIPADVIVDERTGLSYTVEWSRSRAGLGLDHVEASLLQISARNPALA